MTGNRNWACGTSLNSAADSEYKEYATVAARKKGLKPFGGRAIGRPTNVFGGEPSEGVTMMTIEQFS